MAELPIPCYLIDGHGMELHLRRQHPTRGSSLWARLSEWKPAPGDEGAELHFFGPDFQLPKLEPGAPKLACTGLPAEECLSWIRRDARRRTAACRYILVSTDTELRRLAREQGLVVLEPDALLRRLGLQKGAGRREATESPESVRREPTVIKGGKSMSEAELAWWTARMELPEKADSDDFPLEEQVVRPQPEPDPAAEQDTERARLARALGARPGDPRLIQHPDEDWLAQEFPDGEGERPRPQAGRKEKQRRR